MIYHSNAKTNNMENLNLPADFKFPFIAANVSRIMITSLGFNKVESFLGIIEFINGNTRGEQMFTGNTFGEVAIKMQAFADELQKSNAAKSPLIGINYLIKTK